MIDYPLTLELTGSLADGAIDWLSAGENGNVEVGIPPQFDGAADSLSPEELYGLSLLNCYLATFKTLAERSSFSYTQVDVDGELTVERDDDGDPWLSRLELDILITDPASQDRAEELHEQTLANCFIHRSVRTEIETSLETEELD